LSNKLYRFIVHNIRAHVLLCSEVNKAVWQFAANLLSYIPTKYYENWSTSDFVIVKPKW